MASICFYFQLHQPCRLRHFTIFDRTPDYFDETANRTILRRVADRCYLPANALIHELIRRHGGRFRVAFSITGVLLDQLARHAPEVITAFQRLAETGAVEFLAETYYHSLAFLYSREEFTAQVRRHADRMRALFNQTPRVFRNTELTYNNDVAWYVNQMKKPDGTPYLPEIPAIVDRAEALKHAGSAEPEALRIALLKTRDLDTPLGPFGFDASREPMIQPIVQIVENGTFAIVE